jgi:hypothetical protein
VFNSPADLIDRCGFAAPSVYLSPSGYAGLYPMADWVLADRPGVGDTRGACRQRMRSRPHQRHFALQHVDELWQLIHARYAKELADSGDPRIPGSSELIAQWIRLFHKHGPKF